MTEVVHRGARPVDCRLAVVADAARLGDGRAEHSGSEVVMLRTPPPVAANTKVVAPLAAIRRANAVGWGPLPVKATVQ